MAADTAVVLGAGIVFFGITWIAFKLNDSDSDLHKYIGVLFLALAIAVLQVIGWIVVQISLNDVNIAYLGSALVTPMLWILNIVLFIFWLVLLIRAFVFFAITLIHWAGKVFGGETGK